MPQALEKSDNSIALLMKIWCQLSSRRRIQLAVVFFVMLVSGLAELLSLWAAVPFLGALSAPERLWERPMVRTISTRFGYEGSEDLLIPVTVLFISIILIAAAIRLVNLWLNGQISAAVGVDLSGKAYLITLHQPYEIHARRNSSEIINTITTQVGRTVSAVYCALQILTSTFVAIALFSGLLTIDYKITLLAIFAFLGAYWIISACTRQKLLSGGRQISVLSGQVIKFTQEGLGGIRDILLDGSQDYYAERFNIANGRLRHLQASSEFLVGFPRYALEAIGMVSIALMGLLIVKQGNNNREAISVLGVLVLGVQRLLPALQQVFGGWSSIKALNADMFNVLAVLNDNSPIVPRSKNIMPFKSEICFDGVNFRYGPEFPNVLVGLNLKIARGERIGIVGTTGSGKSTAVDILMGLLRPTEGSLTVDGLDINDSLHPWRLAAWRSLLAHVPQQIFLTDATIAENIAFGMPAHDIDYEQVLHAADQANASGFIKSLKDGFSSLVGERGLRLSGGQRQRIGIARALYKKPQVLILDEATSALDTGTEISVMDAIEGLSRNITVIMIAHRISSVRRCDTIVKIENGMIVDMGPPSRVLPYH